MRPIDNTEKINWIPWVAGYGMCRGEATETITCNEKREASDHDVTGITLFGGSGESCAFRARGRGLSCLPAHLEHSDQEARGISRADAHRAQREIVCVYCDRAG